MSTVHVSKSEAGKPGMKQVDIRGGYPVNYSPKAECLQHHSWAWVWGLLKSKK